MVGKAVVVSSRISKSREPMLRVDLDSQQVLQVVDSLVQRSFTVFLSILERSSFRFVITDGMLDSLKSSLANVSREGGS